MTTTSHPTAGGTLVGEASATPTPGGRPSDLWAAGLTDTAIHEAAHACGGVLLLGEVRAVSLRPGRGHRGVTLLGERIADTREIREQEIVVTLLGDIAVQQFGLLEDGWQEDTDDQAAATRAVASLDRLAPLDRTALLEAEAAESDPDSADERRAWSKAWSLNDDALAAEAHLAYLRIVTDGFVRRHRNAISAVAKALVAETTLSGDEVAAIVHATRCVCHRSTWIERRSPPIPPDPAPTVTSDGYQVVLPEPLTPDDPHARIAREGFWCPFWTLPSGHVARGLTWVAEGQLADDRSVLVRRYRGRFRKPTAADREATA